MDTRLILLTELEFAMYMLFVNWMRTVVPLLAGYLLTAAHFLGLAPTSTGTAAAVTVVLTAAYYTAFRLLEHAAERVDVPALRVLAGVLLGWVRPPQADPPSVVADAARGA